MDVDIRGTLEIILSEQIQRLLASKTIKTFDVDKITENLIACRLMPDMIEEDLAKELKLICTSTYDNVFSTSNRLGGFGWSLNHMQQHMTRILKLKLQHSSTILRTKGNYNLKENTDTIKESLQKSTTLEA